MRKIRITLISALCMLVLGAVPIWAAYGPGVMQPGPGYTSPGSVGDVYAYPGFKGKGPAMFDMINSFFDFDCDEDEEDYFSYNQGWHYSPNGWWYLCEDGSWPAGGWKCIDARWYYFTEGGHVKTGWLQDGNNWFYLNPVDDGSYGAMRTGWQIVNGKAYYLNASNEGVYGAMLTNTTTPDGYQVGSDGAMILK